MRTVCLSAEAADIRARLGAGEEVVAVSAFACQEGFAFDFNHLLQPGPA